MSDATKYPLCCMYCEERFFLSVSSDCPVEKVATIAAMFECPKCHQAKWQAWETLNKEEGLGL